ncbi:MAG: ribosome biogenesis GTPase Der [Patescibacteria group bacterium]
MKHNKYNLPLVVIFGRTNVGKSTLFNCLTEKNQALVSNIAGTTRDSNLNEVEWRGKKFTLVDTGGIIDMKYLVGEKDKTGNIEIKVQQQARDYLTRADLILFLVDTQTGLLPTDKQMALFLKKFIKNPKKIILTANKVDKKKLEAATAEFNKLGLKEPVPISAATGAGTGDLLDIVVKRIKTVEETPVDLEEEEAPEEKNSIKVCFIGKPNVGKSSLLNSILGYERVIVSPEPHTTREPQNTEIIYEDNTITLVDTAGISKKGTKGKGLEKHGIMKSLKALERSDIALLVIDINEDITHQDAKLVEEIVERKISLIIIANKWDLAEKKDTKKYTQYIYDHFPFCTWAPIQFTSALTGGKVNKILDLILEIDKMRKIKLGDSQLNKFLVKIVKIHRPAKASGIKKPRIYEFKQTSTNPPRFSLRIGARDTLHFSYIRFIANRLRDKFSFLGTPITIEIDQERRVHGQHAE